MSIEDETMKTQRMTTTFYGRKIRVNPIWSDSRFLIGFNGYDVACYIADGLSVWPCGEMIDAKENTGFDHCKCQLCEQVREILNNK